MADEISVLIVDDSALMRNLIGHMIDDTPGLTVAEKAMNGIFALQKIPRVNPDVICLDLEMPEMNGIEFLKKRKEQGIDIPVVILSSIAARGAQITMEALSLGASDFIQKPSGSISEDIHLVKDTLMGMLLGYGGAYRKSKGKAVLTPAEYKPKTPSAKASDISVYFQLSSSPPTTPTQPPAQARKPGNTEIIAIGISTGGPDALRVVFSKIDADLKVPIVVVQHMPAGFTNEFAKSLDRICPLDVKEAEDGDEIRPGRILIAQGNKHLEVEKGVGGAKARLSDAPLVSGHRPSADVLFASVAMAYSNHALGVIMTGMGRDGAQHLGTIYKEGGMTLGQDEASAVVYGMPRVAYELGHVMEQVSLDNMARRICDVAKTQR
uniref:Protein-glutamate methylesterase/protein-glutamine glutaminase n=1 Tax=uncultured bacterium contig00043 TaxID=1181530 RepID=A0A806KDH5_9BACT|nr:chemotaxis response regulator protein-glutamate methylesterase CheB [uncultured bacterium contig00043]